MEKANKKINAKKVFDILIFVGVFIFFLLALTSAILKFSGTSFKFAKTRYDVVLTDSMATKSEKYKDFLEGHDDQYKPLDVVKSKKVTSPEQLKLYDVVIYKDPVVGTNMHRIVGIQEEGNEGVLVKKAFKGNLVSNSGIFMNEIDSSIETDQISFSEAEFSIFTTNTSIEDRYNFNAFSTDLTPQITKTEVDGGSIFTYKVTRNTKVPAKFYIAHKFSDIDYSKDLIISLKINSSAGNINASVNDFAEEGINLKGKFNVKFLFEIRGDKASVSDGYFTIDDIEAKAVKRIPKLGYLIKFMESIYGVIMFILLGFLLLLVSFLKPLLLKKETQQASNTITKQTKVKSIKVKKTVKKDTSVSSVSQLPPGRDNSGRFVKKNEPKIEDKKDAPQRDSSGRFIKK